MSKRAARYPQFGSFVAGILIGVALWIPVFVATEEQTSPWQALYLLSALALLVGGLVLEGSVSVRRARGRSSTHVFSKPATRPQRKRRAVNGPVARGLLTTSIGAVSSRLLLWSHCTRGEEMTVWQGAGDSFRSPARAEALPSVAVSAANAMSPHPVAQAMLSNSSEQDGDLAFELPHHSLPNQERVTGPFNELRAQSGKTVATAGSSGIG